MNDKFGGHRPRLARLGWMGALLAILGIVALAACSNSGGSPTGTSSSSASTAYTKALAYAQCLRAHGIPNQPDPNSSGQFYIANGSALPSVSPAVQSAAAKACQKLLPATMVKPPTGTTVTPNQLKFSKCMRSHGVPNFPDPGSNGSITLPPGMNAQSPQFQAAEKDCQSLMPMNPGGSAP